MGGEWGVGASLTMESVPRACPRLRLRPAAIRLPGRILSCIDRIRRAVSSISAGAGCSWSASFRPCSCFYIRRTVPESPTWKPTTARSNTLAVLKSHWRLGIYAVLLMTAFNFFSHGTQDLYPTFLQVQHGFSPHEVGLIAVIYNIGAIIGGISFGSMSERFGRRRIVIIAALLSLAVLPLWAFSTTAVWLAIGAFFMQIMVQGRMGRCSRSPQRALARRRPRDISRICLSAGQPHRVGQRPAASGHRIPLWRRLRFCARTCRGRGRHCDRGPHGAGHRSAGHRFRRRADRPIAREHFGLIPASPEEEFR